MSIKKFLISRAFFLNLAVAIALIVGLVALTLNRLDAFTQHGISYTVPDFEGMTVTDAAQAAHQNNLEVKILDSVFSKKAAPGTIVEQVPEAAKQVKDGRVIYLTVNSLEPEKVTLPRLTDISFRQAQVLLDNLGVFIDSISYQPSEYKDLVLKVIQDSTLLAKGDKVLKGSGLHLIVGQSTGNMETTLPDLTGMFTDDAKAALTNARLNLGVVLYDNSFETKDDTLNARIWKQMPDAALTNKVYTGSSVDIWLSADPDKFETETPGEE